MNRQQRRAAGKTGGPNRLAGRTEAEDALRAAFQALTAGRVAEAEAVCRRVLAAHPRHAGALHLLGLVANQVGRLDEANRLIRQAVVLNPRDADALNGLGSVLVRLEKFEEAIGAFDAALAIRPDFAAALANRGHALRRLDRLDEAIASCRCALALQPDLLQALEYLGVALAHRGRFGEAVDAFRRILARRPHDGEILHNLAKALQQAGEPEEAERVARQAIAAAPNDPACRSALAQALMQLGRFDEALATVQAAVALDPGNAETYYVLGTISAELGRKADAIAAFEAATARGPGFVSALPKLADLVDEPARGALLDRMARALAGDPHLPAEDRIALHFALGQDALRRGDGDVAFSHLDEANRMRRAHIDFDIAAEERTLQAIADQFTPERMAGLADAGAPSERPIFVVGMPRSGTTLVEQIFASHPRVWGAGELNIISRLAGALPAPGYPLNMATITGEALTQLGQGYLAATAKLGPDRLRLVDKMPSNFLFCGLIALALPGARIVHCRRDPVDTCLSCYSLSFDVGQPFSYDLAELGRYWRAYDRLMDHWRAVLPAERFLEVRYEDVTADLEGQARRLIQFSGLDWDAACLAFHKTERAVRTASLNQVRRPIYRDSVGRGNVFAAHLGPLLAALGPAAEG